MLMPKRVKHRKVMRGRMRGQSARGDYVTYGEYGVQATSNGWITSRQIEATRVVLTRRVQKLGRLWIRIFPDKPVTKKPAETRMGKGKGEPDHWVAVVKRGRLLFEFEGLPYVEAKAAVHIVGQKLPISVRLVTRNQIK